MSEFNKRIAEFNEACNVLGTEPFAKALINDLFAENERLDGRDGTAEIELCYNDGFNPFAREDLQVVDVGVADNVYIVESKTVEKLQAESKRLRDLLEKIEAAWNPAGGDEPVITEALFDALEEIEEALKGYTNE